MIAPRRCEHDRIRIAYVSADFHEHATSHLMAGLIEHHDRSRFETVGVSFGPDDGSATQHRIRGAFERFLDVRGCSDLEAARRIREHEVDIAVDLKGFTGDCRPGILASRPAPLQVNYLGYPGTMGADFIDYIIADRWVIPPEQRCCYAEQRCRHASKPACRRVPSCSAPSTIPSRSCPKYSISGCVC
jgi:predicted O-linked N-acetylglucosamine transferase (SPINDLY family)